LSLKTLYRKRTVIWPFYFYTIIRTLSNFSALFNYLLIDVNDRKSKVNNLREVINKYKKFDKNTFACTQNVVTISKLRILKINAEDPSGRMKLDFDSMKLVDNEIKNKLIN
ncbi:hypothetical protein P7764_05500, partial [Staphylococcus aureus]|nr:hypothetical protein [Staphylococcus aureus]